MPGWLRKGGLFICGILPILFIVLNSNEGWHRHPGLWETSRYLINDALLVVVAIEIVVLGFLLRKTHKALTGLSLCLASLLACWIALDLYVVVLNTESTGPGGQLCLTHRNWFERVVSNNEHGYWEEEIDAYKPENRAKDMTVVAAVGDSFTWGQGLSSAELRYTDLLDAMLGPQVEILNFGHGGYNTRDLVDRVLPAVGELKPDVVVYFYLANDIHDGIGWPALSPRSARSGDADFWWDPPVYNYLYWKVFAAFDFSQEATRGYDALYARYQDTKNFADHVEDLHRFAQAVREMGAVPVAVNLPFPHLWNNADPQLHREINDKVVKALEDSGMPTLDVSGLEETYPVGQFEVNSMDAHPSAEVHRAIADKVEPWLGEQLKR